MAGLFKHSGTIAVSLVAALAICTAASAKSKMTYEQAYEKCKGEIAGNVPMSDSNTSAARYTAGSACMKKYGYRLKKS